MLELSPVVKVEKNKLNTDGVFLVGLHITIPGITEAIRIINNNEDIEWPTGSGNIWQAFPFDVDEMSDNSKAEVSQFNLKVSNVNNVIGDYVRQYDVYVKQNGFEPIDIVLYVINSNDLASIIPAFSHELVLSAVKLNMVEATFTVSARDVYRVNIPTHKMYPNLCRFKFKSDLCGYSGLATVCDKTLKRCRELGNNNRYGGFPAVGNQGTFI